MDEGMELTPKHFKWTYSEKPSNEGCPGVQMVNIIETPYPIVKSKTNATRYIGDKIAIWKWEATKGGTLTIVSEKEN